jgi:two-component system, sensor histidine kinase RegB
MGIELPLLSLGVLMACSILSNLAVALWLRREPPVTEGALGGLMALDLALFTGLLYYTGGPFNPFSTLYLIHLALSALVLSSRWTWTLVAMAVLANAGLFLKHVPLDIDHGAHGAPHVLPARGNSDETHAHHGSDGHSEHSHHGSDGHSEHAHHGSDGHSEHAHHGASPAGDVLTARPSDPSSGPGEPLGMHLQGMWVAFGVTAALIVYFLRRVSATLAEQEGELARMRDQAARVERLGSVATLAAGAAHELATPLSTIAVVARELERSASGAMAEDAKLIREQVARCRTILSQMAGSAGESPGEVPEPTRIGDLIHEVVESLAEAPRVRVSEAHPGALACGVVAPRKALVHALRNVVQNALDAAKDDEGVCIEVHQRAGLVTLTVIDCGGGMPADVVRHVFEPFFTTKAPGQGMGLGLFLTRSVLDLMGGDIAIETEQGKGTTVTIQLPSAVASPKAAKELKPVTEGDA